MIFTLCILFSRWLRRHNAKLVASIVAIAFAAASLSASAQEWRPVEGTDARFNTAITRVSPTVVRVWEKYALPPEQLDYARANGLTDKYIGYAYTLALQQIDCEARRHGFVAITDYNSKGLPTARTVTVPDEKIDMQPVEPDTNAGALVDTVCEHVTRRGKKK